jgi:hypothetical protein
MLISLYISLIKLAFGANARMGVDLDLEMCLMSMKAKVIMYLLTPFTWLVWYMNYENI